jgi:hypothetical protein
MTNEQEVRMDTKAPIDLVVDLNTMDDTGLPWAFIERARNRVLIRPGNHIVVGSGSVQAVAVVADVTDGIVHVQPIRGSVEKNRHLLTSPLLA